MFQLMFTIKILLGLKSNQGDVIASFLRVDIGEGENVYVDMRKGFGRYSKTGHKKCLKLKNNLYGLRHIICAFCQYLTNKLESFGLKQ